jgi:hypothetical protein
VRWISWLIVAACSSGSTAHGPTRPAPPVGSEPTQTAPSERDCDELITHAVALGIEERTPHSDEPATTPADHEAVRRKLADDFLPGCRALSREALRCALAATTLAALAACQPTRTSSTSNSSVEPGGMTLPKPRSP